MNRISQALVCAIALALPAAASWADSVTGTISNVDLNRSPKQIELVDDKGNVHQLMLDEQASIKHDGQEVPETHLTVGQTIEASVDKEAGQEIAKALNIKEEDLAASSPSAKVERTEIRSEALTEDRTIRTERADVDVSREEDRRLNQATRVEQYRVSTTSVDEWGQFPEFRIVPTGTMRPGASITGPSAPDGSIRAALPLAREPESSINTRADGDVSGLRSEWSRESRTVVVD